MRRFAALGVALSLGLASAVGFAEPEGGPDAVRPSPAWMPGPPTASVERDRPGGRRWGVFSAGLSLFAAGYAADVGVTYGLHHGNAAVSLIPVIGPLVQLGDKYQLADPKSVATGNPTIDQQSSQMINEGNHAYQSLIYTGLVIDAAVQLAGVVTAIVGAASHRHHRAELISSSGRGAMSIKF